MKIIFMEKEPLAMNKFFLDAAYTIALSAVTDKYHQMAENLAKQIENEGISLVTTRAVIL